MAADVGNLVLEQLRAIRSELTEQRQLALQTVGYVRRMDQRLETRMVSLERRLGDLGDDLELMLKAELLGRFAHFEISVEHQLTAWSDRVAAMETHSG